jgi:hypothetical protein
MRSIDIANRPITFHKADLSILMRLVPSRRRQTGLELFRSSHPLLRLRSLKTPCRLRIPMR